MLVPFCSVPATCRRCERLGLEGPGAAAVPSRAVGQWPLVLAACWRPSTTAVKQLVRIAKKKTKKFIQTTTTTRRSSQGGVRSDEPVPRPASGGTTSDDGQFLHDVRWCRFVCCGGCGAWWCRCRRCERQPARPRRPMQRQRSCPAAVVLCHRRRQEKHRCCCNYYTPRRQHRPQPPLSTIAAAADAHADDTLPAFLVDGGYAVQAAEEREEATMKACRRSAGRCCCSRLQALGRRHQQPSPTLSISLHHRSSCDAGPPPRPLALPSRFSPEAKSSCRRVGTAAHGNTRDGICSRRASGALHPKERPLPFRTARDPRAERQHEHARRPQGTAGRTLAGPCHAPAAAAAPPSSGAAVQWFLGLPMPAAASASACVCGGAARSFFRFRLYCFVFLDASSASCVSKKRLQSGDSSAPPPVRPSAGVPRAAAGGAGAAGRARRRCSRTARGPAGPR